MRGRKKQQAEIRNGALQKREPHKTAGDPAPCMLPGPQKTSQL